MPSLEMTAVLAANAARRSASADAPAPTVQELRRGYDSSPHTGVVPADVSVEAANAGGVKAHWLTPPGPVEGRTVVHLHGGAYVLGSLASHGELAARIGRSSHARVLLPEYRLAPEHPFPTALDDALATWRWAVAQGAEPGDTALVGDSAGGGLALALLVALRDAGETLPGVVALMSPWTDLTLSGASLHDKVDDDLSLTPALLSRCAALYLNGVDPAHPSASPLFADVRRLPPVLVQVGSAEILLSDSERLVTRLQASACAATLDVADGLPHVYQRLAGTPEAHAATSRLGSFVDEVLTRPPKAR